MTRDVDRWRLPVTTFDSFDSFHRHRGPLPAGIVSIAHNGSWLDMRWRPVDGATTTLVSFHAALGGRAVSLPYFTGATVARGEPINRLLLSDPALYVDDRLRLAWFAGTLTMALQARLPPVVARFADGTRPLLFGASGGGFAALYYSAVLPGSLAVAVNPQTDIRTYGAAWAERYARLAFGARTAQEVDRVFDDVVVSDLRPLYARPLRHDVVYLQNRQDRHVEEHMEPLLAVVRDQDRDRVRVTLRDWGEGHVPAPADELSDVVAEHARRAW